MRISIDNVDVKTKSGVGRNDREYAIHTQSAYLDTGKRYPVECKIRIENPDKPYPPGEYTVDLDKSVYVTKYGAVQLSEELVLVEFGGID